MSPGSQPAACSTLKLLAALKVSDIWRKMSPLKHIIATAGPKGLGVCCRSAVWWCVPGSANAERRAVFLMTLSIWALKRKGS